MSLLLALHVYSNVYVTVGRSANSSVSIIPEQLSVQRDQTVNLLTDSWRWVCSKHWWPSQCTPYYYFSVLNLFIPATAYSTRAYFYLVETSWKRFIPNPSLHATLIMSSRCPGWIISTAFCWCSKFILWFQANARCLLTPRRHWLL
jgi:hypothetical protein